ncbi:MAG TPA: hypothetical protein VGY97_13185 [Solirubrobacteraceae bacterium]|jgi:hypothetical protein|nr:hypothetical protein [Solirubrobacteraceae bacterium]
MIPLAHFGHVLVDLPIFFGPVVALTGWILFITRRDRRRQRRAGGGPGERSASHAAG